MCTKCFIQWIIDQVLFHICGKILPCSFHHSPHRWLHTSHIAQSRIWDKTLIKKVIKLFIFYFPVTSVSFRCKSKDLKYFFQVTKVDNCEKLFYTAALWLTFHYITRSFFLPSGGSSLTVSCWELMADRKDSTIPYSRESLSPFHYNSLINCLLSYDFLSLRIRISFVLLMPCTYVVGMHLRYSHF